MTRPTSGRRRIQPDPASLDDLLGWTPAYVIEPRGSRRRTLLGGAAAIAATSLLGVTLSLPVLGASAITLREANDYWDAMPSSLPVQAPPARSVILAADGTQIAQFYSENRVPVRIDEVPAVMREAIIAIEDSRFYSHHGVDLRGTARALVTNLTSDSTQGGSTLTQQYVKNVLASAAETDAIRREVTSRTSYLRKLREAKLAIEAEETMTKDEILEGYLNIAYFGDGAYGVGTAAQHYFSRPVADLTLAQAALLAGLVKNPTGYDPTDHPKAARERRDLVLARMHDLGDIGGRAYQAARRDPLALRVSAPANGCGSSRFPFFCQWVKEQLAEDPAFGRTQAVRNERLFRGGLTIRTSLDPAAQHAAQAAVDAALGRDNRVATSSVTVEPGTGRVVAMATNRSFGTPEPGHFDKTQMVLPTLAAFQPGSNFKPFTLAAAVERGFDTATTITAPAVYAPTGMNYPGEGFTNSGSAEAGTFTAATALARSSNTWFVRLEEQVGVLNVASMAERLGITSLPRTGPSALTERDASLTLGAYEVSPVEMAGAYAALAAHGVACRPLPIDSVTGPDGNEIAAPSRECHQAVPASVADTVAAAMTGVIDGPDPYRTGKAQSIGRPAAGKTGTTQDNAAVWFSGFTPQYATSVWVGDPRGGFAHPLQGFYAHGQYVSRAYGGLVAGPIWQQVMLALHHGLPVEEFAVPTGTTAEATLAPDVRGLSLAAAYRALDEAGYEVILDRAAAEDDGLTPAGVVAASTPGAGSFLPLGSTVRLTMSAGSQTDVRLP